MEFDTFGLSVKDLTTQNVITRLNSTGLLYTMRLPGSVTPSSSTVTALNMWLHLLGIIILVILTMMPYLACLGHLLFIVPAINMICVMLASWENTSGCLFLVHQIIRLRPLI
jgi:hypothetical protein